jgi:hypothetical protein
MSKISGKQALSDAPFQSMQFRRTRQQRRRAKFIRFLVCEILAIGALLFSAILGISQRFADDSLTGIFKMLTISAAIAVAIIPVIFYGITTNERSRKR